MTCSRRAFLATTLAALPMSRRTTEAGQASPVSGVLLGVQTYSFHDIMIDGRDHSPEIIAKMQACGVSVCEIFAAQIEPNTWPGVLPPADVCPTPLRGCLPKDGDITKSPWTYNLRNPWAWKFARLPEPELSAKRARQKQWRETVDLGYFREIAARFKASGITVFAYNPYFAADASDLELERGFETAKALGCRAVGLSTTHTMLKRLVPYAEKHGVIAAAHNHSITWNPEEFATRDSLVRAMALSPMVGVNLDVGHYAAANENPIEFIDSFHDRITHFHLKDRRRNRQAKIEDGLNMPWGEGETPLADVLRHLRRIKSKKPALIEYEYAGSADPVDEVRRCVEYCRKALA
jgi:sugar phosphate isomerase/epimerase